MDTAMSAASPKCILVVEDDDAIRDLIAEILDGAGYRVERAADGLQALVKVRAARPDIVVLDLMMPVMDGWTFLEQFRQIPDYTGTPVVVTSAYRAHSDSETVRDLQVQAYLAKPFDVDTLVGVVERLL
jgi:two-component system chemotaxis response regulator CheY